MTARAPVSAGTYTFTTTVADVVTFGSPFEGVEVDNHDPVNSVWIATDSTTTAVAEAVSCVRIPPASTKTIAGCVGPLDPRSLVGSGGKYTVAGVKANEL